MTVENEYAEIAKRFGSVAERYCAIVEIAAQLEKTAFLLQIYRILPELVEEATRLPDTDPWERNEPDASHEAEDLRPYLAKSRVTSEMGDKAWHDLYELIKERLGDSHLYWHVFDPIKGDNSIQASLADDIADVYRDLSNGITQWKQHGAKMAEVIWEWRFGFYWHWGDHAISALRTIHRVLGEKLNEGDIA